MTGTWLAVFSGMLLTSLIGGLWPSEPRPSRLFVLAFQLFLPGFMTYILLGLGIAFNFWYPKHFRSAATRAHILVRYSKQIQDWNARHPDHSWVSPSE